MAPGHSCIMAEGPPAPAGVRRGPGGQGKSEEGTFFLLGTSQQRGAPGECRNHRRGHGGPEARTPAQVPGAGTSVRAQIPAHLRIPNFQKSLEGSEQIGTEMLRLEQEGKPSQPPGPLASPVCAFLMPWCLPHLVLSQDTTDLLPTLLWGKPARFSRPRRSQWWKEVRSLHGER